MDRHRLRALLDPENTSRDARSFRLLHHALVAFGIAVLLADTVQAIRDQYEIPLDTGFLVVAAFFVGEYVLRLYVATAAPGGELHQPWRTRLHWALSGGGLLHLVGALPIVLTLLEREPAVLASGIWIFKYL